MLSASEKGSARVSETVTLHLPYPPSANALWRSVGGRNISSKAYRVWQSEAASIIAQQRTGAIFGTYGVTFQCERPDNRRRDIANLEKALSDALVSGGVVEDDYLAEQISLFWAPKPEGRPARINVHVWARPRAS